MYVAVKGGERAIESAHAWLAEERRGDTDVAELSITQIREQLKLAVDRVMAEALAGRCDRSLSVFDQFRSVSENQNARAAFDIS